MTNELDPEIRSALAIELRNEEQFAGRLLFASRRRRERRLYVAQLASIAAGVAITVGGASILPALLANANQAQAICGVGLLLVGCACAASMDGETAR